MISEIEPNSATATSFLFRLKHKEPDSWNQLVKLYGPLIFNWCKRCDLSDADASDVLQEVFSIIDRKIASFQKQELGTFRGWLWTITRNKVLDFQKSRRGKVAATGGTQAQIRLAEYCESILESDEDPTSASESSQLVSRAMELIRPEFGDRSWAAFRQVVMDQRATKDVADDLDMTPSGVRQAKRRILKRLREQLAEIEPI